ncbi:ABC transporter substrate-binding protein [Flavobacteriaceae bacterium]|nr:ABC transporter substrate-binding protein [Flavobacteriaceae bacterium]
MRKTRLRTHLIGITLSIFIVTNLVSCDQNSLKDKDHLVFRYNEYKNITSLDPAFTRILPNIWATNQIFNGLVQLDDSLNVKPDIAKSWNISEEGLVYKFKLRQDVFFHESIVFKSKKRRKVIASDFVYSLNRLKDPKTASPGGWVLQNVKSLESVNDSLLKFTLKKPFPAFLGLLSMRYCSVVPHEAIEEYGEDFRSNPVGTGPFTFKRWEENVKLVFRKNPNYHETDIEGIPLPYLEAIAITFVPDIQSEFMLFIQGKTDLLNSLDNSYKDELLEPDGALQNKYLDKINMEKGPYLNTEYLGFYLDSKSKVIKSPLIREAINIGFDRQKLVLYLRNNIGFKANKGFIPKGLPGHAADDFTAYDSSKAALLVKEFKEKTGLEPKITLSTDANYVDICEYLQRELQKIGIDIKIDVMPPATLKQARSSGKLEMFRSSWIADYPDAENYLSLLYSKNFSPTGPNYTHFSDPEFDVLFEKSFEISNPRKRAEIYQKMDSIAMKKHPMILLYYDQVIRFSQKNVEGLSINPINLLNLKRVRKNKS